MEDDCLCEYDSTWDTESDGEEPVGDGQPRRSRTLVSRHHTPRNMRAAKDMQNYRRGYPNLTDDDCSEDKMNNLQFYLNKFPSAPDEFYIESFLKEWKNDYKRLERVHSYIQWLFPLREPGVNYMASELTKKEIEAFKRNEDAKRRLVESYELMLGFYGIRLVNKEIGEVTRAENWKERFGNLERNMHNNLRITRILKSLGELGFEHFQAPLVQFFLEETLVKKNLSNVKRSVLDYFLFAVLDKQKRQELLRFAYLHFEPKDKFVWCPRKIQKQFRKAEKRSEAVGNGDGKDDVYSRAKSKDGEKGLPVKEEEVDNAGKAQKQMETNGDQITLPELSAHPKGDKMTIGNGNSESNNNSLGKSNDSNDEDDEMEQSPTPDTVTVTGELSADIKSKPTNSSRCAIQETDHDMQTDEDIKPEKPMKKKREDDSVTQSNGANADVSGGQAEVKSAGDVVPLMSLPARMLLKTSKPSTCLSSGREEKIPRTDFTKVPDKGLRIKSNNNSLGKSNDSIDEDDEMEQSPTPDTVTVKNELSADIKFKPTNSSRHALQETDHDMQTDEDVNPEKSLKKKREEDSVSQSNTAVVSGDQAEVKSGGDVVPLMSLPARMLLKTSKPSTCLSSGREEKIPRTDFTKVPDKGLHANGSVHKNRDELTIEKKVEDVDMESNPSSLDPNVGNT
ncbi:opioid growth factor receptor [Corythoichthys intestinalis]|uniref:opioid growth factor receptor n=1 Tax=Corythoichthys intestinalis TaxID=161448 RepID=UPI0025A554BA|nr:opioid growth factor receptor [Corythoichthys intestinalis]